MKKFAIAGALKLPRTDVVAMICGTLCSVVAALPARSADLYPYPEYTAYGPGYSGYYRGCSTCGCRPCCNPCGHRPIIQPGPVVERHWDYWERRYPAYPNQFYPTGYAGSPYYPYPSSYAGGYPYSPNPNDYPAYGGAPRPHLGFGGVQYPPAPISYQTPPPPYGYQAAAPYDYRAAPPAYDQTAARPGYDYEMPPRPPVGIRGPYSNASYVE